ncbi:hypothetical protein H113_02286 [Trichophyton rubrum MR1459]|nr:hypothetical protein H113_02286 [Trichophyton rubrum MR1459]EZG08674.1 hypothetical protein H106_02147 [Trichophyton rubrum CBS 735.88]
MKRRSKGKRTRRRTYRSVHSRRSYMLAGRIKSGRKDFACMACKLHYRSSEAACPGYLRSLLEIEPRYGLKIINSFLLTDCIRASFFPVPLDIVTALRFRLLSDR